MSKPLISFIVFSYKQEHFIGDAIDSAFAQDYENVEIILSDDCSPDKTYEVMQAMAETYTGNHSVKLLEQAEKNLGLVGHLNRVFANASGDWIVLCAGDDAATPNRCSEIARFIAGNSKLRGIYSGYQDCDKSLNQISEVLPGRKAPISTWRVCRNGGYVYPGATFALHRDCIEHFAPLDENLRAEDWVLPLHAAALGEIGFIQQSLVNKRNLDDSLTVVNKSFYEKQPLGVFDSPELMENLHTIQRARAAGKISTAKTWLLPIMLRLYARIRYCKLAGPNAGVGSLLAAALSSLLLFRVSDFFRFLSGTVKRR